MTVGLVVLVPDKDIEVGVTELLKRSPSLGCDLPDEALHVQRHPHRDPGCYLTPHEFLRLYLTKYEYAMVILDREGAGRDDLLQSEIRETIEESLTVNGWAGRCRAVVCEPEFEEWVWGPSPKVLERIGWAGTAEQLVEWLELRGFERNEIGKWTRPKEALELLLQHSGKPRSSTLYGDLAKTVSLSNCQSPSFRLFTETLREWFPKL